MSKSFSASIGGWASQTKERITAVHRRSVELLGEEMANTIPNGGKVPFQDGNLMRSLLASTVAMPPTAEGPFSGSNVGAVAATLEPHQSVYIGYQAGYARRQNYGFVGEDSLGRLYNQTGHYFVEDAIAKWPQLVNKAVTEIKGE